MVTRDAVGRLTLDPVMGLRWVDWRELNARDCWSDWVPIGTTSSAATAAAPTAAAHGRSASGSDKERP